MDSLFRPFAQADSSTTRKFGGTGLGLTISKRLAVMLGGDLVCKSELGEGSTFSLTVQTGSLRNVTLLDNPQALVEAAEAPAHHADTLTAIDHSEIYLAAAQAKNRDPRIRMEQGDGCALRFADASFDRIWGHAVLHHLDVSVAAQEVRRVLRPGGVAVFCEPWGENPLLRWARTRLPYPGKERTPEEYGVLFERGGFELTRIVPTQGEVSVVEGKKR